MLTSKTGQSFETLEDFSFKQAPKEPEAPRVRVKPEGKLSDMNIEQELFEAYHAARSLRDRLMDELGDDEDDDAGPTGITPANQIAQVMNTVTSILKDITKMQTELYNAQRLKDLEHCLITAIKGTPEDIQSAFFTEYEALIKKTEQ